MSTQAVIALTPDALAVLFPEGSQARIELQRASLSLAAKHFAKNALGPEAKVFLRETIEDLNRVQQTALLEELRTNFGNDAIGMGRNRYMLTQDVKDRIREAVKGEVTAFVRSEVEAAIAHETDRLNDLADSAAKRAVYAILKTQLVATTEAELRQRLANLQHGVGS